MGGPRRSRGLSKMEERLPSSLGFHPKLLVFFFLDLYVPFITRRQNHDIMAVVGRCYVSRDCRGWEGSLSLHLLYTSISISFKDLLKSDQPDRL